MVSLVFAVIISGLLFLGLLLNVMERNLFSSTEMNDRFILEQILEARRKIVKTNDDAEAQALKTEVERLQEELSNRKLDYLRDENGAITTDWREVLLLARERLLDESSRLTARSNGNLWVGLSISIIAVVILVYLIFGLRDDPKPESWFDFLSSYGPRFTLVVIVQILASFFLRMYVSIEKDILRNKNEITNLELRLAAGMIVGNSPSSKSNLAQAMVTEERNFVLDKKQTSSKLKADTKTEVGKTVDSIRGLIKDLKP